MIDEHPIDKGCKYALCCVECPYKECLLELPKNIRRALIKRLILKTLVKNSLTVSVILVGLDISKQTFYNILKEKD